MALSCHKFIKKELRKDYLVEYIKTKTKYHITDYQYNDINKFYYQGIQIYKVLW
jgi:hypothetical protein